MSEREAVRLEEVAEHEFDQLDCTLECSLECYTSSTLSCDFECLSVDSASCGATTSSLGDGAENPPGSRGYLGGKQTSPGPQHSLEKSEQVHGSTQAFARPAGVNSLSVSLRSRSLRPVGVCLCRCIVLVLSFELLDTQRALPMRAVLTSWDYISE